jgi:hypothetical protein
MAYVDGGWDDLYITYTPMNTRALLAGIALCGLFVGACGEDPADPGPSVGRTGGTGGSGGSGGRGGSTGTTTGGSGGSTATGGSGVSTGGSGGSGGSSTTTGGAGGSGGSGGSGGAGGSGGSGGGTATDGGTKSDAQSGNDGPPAVPGNAPYGCTGCKRIFDGQTLNGWHTAPGSWEVKEGALSSTGKNGDIYTAQDYGSYRIFFQVKQIKGNHKPCTTLFGKRPADPMAVGRGLGGAQFQPPNGASWNYGVGGTFTRVANPNFNVNNWHQCEVVVKEAGEFKAACCPVAEGGAACKGVEVLRWKGPGRKHPFNFMIHNPGLFDQYKEVWLEENPTDEAFLSQK